MPDEPLIEEPQGQPQEPETKEPEKTGEPQKPFDYETGYKELQSKFNQRDGEIKAARQTAKEKEELEKIVNNWNSFLEADPELYRTIEEKVKPKTESNGEAPDEVKATITQNVVREFETKYGIDKLNSEKAQELRNRIRDEIGLVTGASVAEVPLSKLSAVLERGYTLATKDDREEQARQQGYIEARENREAEIGSIQSTGVNSQSKPLTPDEQSVARKLHISDEEYAKYKDK